MNVKILNISEYQEKFLLRLTYMGLIFSCLKLGRDNFLGYVYWENIMHFVLNISFKQA
jgi:hypothetical protein